MGLHGFPFPQDYVHCYHTSRQGIYEDSGLTGGNVRIKLGYVGGPIEDGFNRGPGPVPIHTSMMEVGAVTPDFGLEYRWQDGSSYYSATNGQLSLGANVYPNFKLLTLIANPFIGVANHLDSDISVVCSATVEAGLARALGDQDFLSCTLDIGVGRVVVSKIYGGQGPVLMTGTTPIVANQMYTVRMVNVGSAYSVYLDGHLEGTFDDAGYFSTLRPKPAIAVRGADLGARIDNFYLAKTSNPLATSFELRNYRGDVIFTGPVNSEIIDIPDSFLTVDGVAGHRYGWYRLYLRGPERGDGKWGTSYGDCSFIRIPTYAGFATNPTAISQKAIAIDGIEELERGVMALGIPRYSVTDPSIPAATTIDRLQPSVAKLKETWRDTGDAERPRKTLIAFPNGVDSTMASNISGIVNGLKQWVNVWSPRNEPNFHYGSPFSTSIPNYINNEVKVLYEAVKAADPTATVVAPGCVNFSPASGAIAGNGHSGGYHGSDEFLQAFLFYGGDAYCDAYEVHPYNCYNGDLIAMRMSLSYLQYIIATWGNPNKDIYQTEQGFAHVYNGMYWPHYAGRWTALMFFAQEVLTMGKMRYENSFYWYDLNIGFGEFPMYWLTPTGPGPQPCAVRTQAGETRGKHITSELDFGVHGKEIYCGGVWTNPNTGDKTIGVISGSCGANDIRFAVTGASSFVRVDSWGNQTTLTASGGFITFPVSELGSWLRVPSGTTAALVPADWDWGTNFCESGLPFTNSPTLWPAGGTGYDAHYGGTATNTVWNLPGANTGFVWDPAGRYDGTLWNQKNFNVSNTPLNPDEPSSGLKDIQLTRPMIYGVTFNAPRTVNRVVLWCQTPWHQFGTLTDFDIQTYDGATWTTRYTFNSTANFKSFPFIGVEKCVYETYWDDQFIFNVRLPTPVTNCQGVRLYVRHTSWGGFADQATSTGGSNGQDGWGEWLEVRELQAFNDTVTTPLPAVAPTFVNATPPTPTSMSNRLYAYKFYATGSPGIVYTVNSGTLPPPMTLGIPPGQSGTTPGLLTTGLYNTGPNTAGTYTFTVRASNGVAPDAVTPPITIVVNPALPGPVLVNATPTTPAVIGQLYQYQFTASSSTPVTWDIVEGNAPYMTLSPSGLLSGIPEPPPQSRSFKVRARNDGLPDAFTPTLTIFTVTGPPPNPVGTVARTLAAVACAASGSVGSPVGISGTLARTFANVTSVASGTVASQPVAGRLTAGAMFLE